ncbi:MAG: ABC transporter permease [Candidatus Eremiobacteraeota bacterium]|nr:ABC transporter permease [Candidatus Eremiobacteraeota bacterium]MCW5872042.1 ABC transporter permease [Candidatus Eremiobacteraeota bacterium]
MAASQGEQLNVLCERYLEIVFSDRGNTFLLLLQAPLIALFVVLTWRDVDHATDSLYYVLALTALWFGTFNACREVVKEGPILDREARLGLQPGPYLLSKLLVLALLSFVQCLGLCFIVNHNIPLGGPPLFHFVYLWLTSLGGIALGLLISCLMSNSDKAVGSVVLVLIPQMLFSEMVLSHEHASKLIRWAEDFTFLAWAFQGMKEVTRSEWSYVDLTQAGFMLALLTAVLLAGCLFLLTLRTRKARA